MRRLLPVLALLLATPAAAQVSVTGTVADSTGAGLPGATVVLLQPADSVLVSFAASRGDGTFELRRVRPGDYLLQVSFVGYQTATDSITVAREALDVGTVTLRESTDELGELRVDADRVPIVLRGDTLDYNADAFGAPAGSTVEDLLKRLPGVEVERDGSVTAQGERVERVLVDGKEFFGDDPTVATRNLPADAVDRVQVYDKASETAEFTGVDDGEEERTINLELKEDRKTGAFGSVSGGLGGAPSSSGAALVPDGASGGDVPRATGPGLLYDGRASVNRFSPTVQLSLLANVNNVNRESFSIGDYFQFMGGPGAFMSGGGGTFTLGGDLPIGDGLAEGYTDTASGGLNASADLGEATELRANYLLTSTDRERAHLLQRDQFLGGGLASRLRQTSDGTDRQRLHRLGLTLRHEFADGHDISLRTNGSLGLTNALQDREQRNLAPDGAPQSASDTRTDSDGHSLRGDATLTYRRRLGKRSLVGTLSGSAGDSRSDTDFLAANEFYARGDLLSREEIDQLQNGRGETRGAGATLLFTQPLARRQALQARLSHRESREGQRRETFDLVEGARVLNPLQSSDFTRGLGTSRAGLTYTRSTDALRLSLGADAQLVRLRGTQDGGDALGREYVHALPTATLSYAISQSRNAELSYSTSTREPTVRELQPVVDNDDPLRIYVGNPDLRPAYTHSLSARYLSFDPFTSTNLFGFVRAAYSPTAISTARTVDAQLRQRLTPVNTSGEWTVNGTGSFGTLVRAVRSRVGVTANGLYTRGIELVNGDENASSILRLGGDLRVQNRDKERVDVVAGARLTYNRAAYSLNPELDRDYVNRGLFAELGWTPTEALSFRTELDLNVYGDAVGGRGLAPEASGARSVPLWRAEAAYRLPGGRARIEVEAADLLDRNLGVSTTSTAAYVQESRVSSLGRFVLLRFVYNLGGERPGGGGIRITTG